MQILEICCWELAGWFPCHGDHGDISMTHHTLPKDLEAVIWDLLATRSRWSNLLIYLCEGS
jgi:hypothetical protein